MTAQIAILNRVGVALAADSAVSIRPTVSAERKIYSSVDKLFLLSNTEPIGVMINGRAEFLGAPAETLIKTFRDSSYASPQASVADYAKRFFTFLSDAHPGDEENAREYAATLAVNRLSWLVRYGEDAFEEAAESGQRVDFKSFFSEVCREKLAVVLKIARARAPLKGVSEANLPVGLNEIARHSIDRMMGSDFLDLEDAVAELITLLMTRNIESGDPLKLVFAGFGCAQQFPAVVAADCDGPLVGTHKIRVTVEDEISENAPALIKPFAQTELVARFMDGVDDSYSEFVGGVLKKALERFADHAMKLGSKRRPSQRVRAELATLREHYVEEILRGAEEFRIDTYRNALLDVVQFMPKSDLAEMARSLVNLQSINETVGGPIDVAVISKNDGFVWIDRKHYFGAEINSRFFAKQTSRMNRWMLENGDVER